MGGQDRWRWGSQGNGIYTVRKAYDLLMIEHVTILMHGLFGHIWLKELPTKKAAVATEEGDIVDKAKDLTTTKVDIFAAKVGPSACQSSRQGKGPIDLVLLHGALGGLDVPELLVSYKSHIVCVLWER
ncbi:hypothetical protein Ancab_004328 [Ancistrocladus abbreviatus]